MATVIDQARGVLFGQDVQKQAHNTTYQKGNDNASTPTPTWLDTLDLQGPDTLETHIPNLSQSTTGVNNTLDDWVPHVVNVFLTSTPATVRF